MSVFRGIWLPLVTPFADGEVDFPALRRLLAEYRRQPLAGIAALGSTGEAAALSPSEQEAVLDTILEEAGGLPVMVGVGGSRLAEVQERVQRFGQRPVAGLMVSAPAYVRPSQAGLLHWFTVIADAATAPVVLYDIPYRTGVRIELETLLTLAAHPNIQAIKDCGGDVEKTRRLIVDGRLQVLSGEDAAVFSSLCQGGSGAIAAAAHLCPELYGAMAEALAAGRLEPARQIHHALAPLVQGLFREPNPAGIKALLAARGLIRNELRPPLMPVSPALWAELDTLWTDIAAFAQSR